MLAPGSVLRFLLRAFRGLLASLTELLCFLGLLWCLLYFLLNSGFTAPIFETLAGPQFRGSLSWTRLTFGPLPWQLRVLEVVIRDPQGQPVISADEVHIEELRLLSILGGRIAAEGITVVRPQVRLVRRPHGELRDEWDLPAVMFNIQEVFTSPEIAVSDGQPGGPPPLDFSEIDIIDGRVSLDMNEFSLRSRALNVGGARFALLDDEISMGARAVNIGRALVRIPIDETSGPPAHARRDQVYAWRVSDLNLSHYLWQGFAFQVATIDARVYDQDDLRVRELKLDLERPGVPWARARVRYNSPEIHRTLKQFGVDDVRGPVSLSLTGEGEIDAFDARIELRSEGLSLPGGVRLDTLDLALHKDEADRISLTRLDVAAYQGNLTGTAEFDPLRGDVSVALEGTGLDLKHFPVQVPGLVGDLAAGPARLGVRLNATDLYDDRGARRASAAVRVDLRRTGGGPEYGFGRAVRLDLIADYAAGQLDLKRLSLDGRSTQVQASGHLALEGATAGGRLAGRVRAADLQTALAPFDLPLGGNADVEFTVGGDLRAPKVSGRVRGRDLTWPGAPKANLDARLTFDVARMRLDLANADLSIAAGRAALSGWFDLSGRQPRFDAKVSTRGLKLDALPLPVDVGGVVDLDAQAKGTLRAPRVTGTLRVARPRFEKLALRRIDLAGSFANDRIEVEKLSVADDDGELAAVQGWFVPRTGAFDGSVRLDRITPALATPFLDTPLPVLGTVSVALVGHGTLADPEGSGRIDIVGVEADGLALGDGHLEVTAANRRLNLTGRFFDALSLTASVPTARGGETGRVEVVFDEFAVEDRVPTLSVAGVSARLAGTASANFDPFAGTVEAIEVTLPQLVAGYTERDRDGRVVRTPGGRPCPECPTVQVEAVEPVRVSWRDNKAWVDALHLRLGDEVIDISGTASPQALDLKVGGSIDLGALWPFLRTIFTDVEGQIDLAMRVTGSPSDPQLTGQVTLVSAELVPRSATIGSEVVLLQPATVVIEPPLGPSMPGPDGKLPTGVFIVDLPPLLKGARNPLRLRRDDAVVEVTVFDAFFEGWRPTALVVEIRTDEAEFDIPRTLSASVSTPGLRVEMWEEQDARRQVVPRLRISGHVDLLRGEYVADVSSAAEISRGVSDNLRGRSAARTVSAFEKTPLLRNLELDLSIRGSDEIYVRNKVTVLDLNLAVALDLTRVSGMPYPQGERPLVIEGRVDVLEDSQITYARRPFDVTLGSVVFRPEKFMTADVEATHTFRLRTDRGNQAGTFDRGASGDVREEEVTLKVAVIIDQLNTPPTIDLNLSSSSGASKIEVATLVLTGAYPSDLTGAASAAPATEVLLAPVLNLIEAPFEETLDVDLSLTPATTGTLFIDADKLLSRRLRLYTRTPVGDDANNNLQTFGLEYRLNNEATLEATNERLGNLNSTGGRLRLRLLLD